MQSFSFASRAGFFERMGKVFGGLGVFVAEAMDDTAGAVVFEALRLGGNEFVQDLCRGRL